MQEKINYQLTFQSSIPYFRRTFEILLLVWLFYIDIFLLKCLKDVSIPYSMEASSHPVKNDVIDGYYF